MHRTLQNIRARRWTHHSTRYNYNPDHFSEQEPPELQQVIRQFTPRNSALTLYDAQRLATFHRPPRPAISLSRDFIHDSLYNPHYGYFFNQVEILDTTTHQNLSSLTHPNYLDHQQKLVVVGRDLSPPHDQASIPSDPNLDQRQIWHTPSELFKPWYAWSIAGVMVKNHLEERSKTKHPSKRLNIYEIGAGNGTLCCGIMDYIRQNHPEIYAETNYVIIELSTRLAERQRQKISESNHEKRATVINQSILSLSDSSSFTPTQEPCWILGMEVLDNLSRDVIRRDPITLQPLQSIVITDLNGDFHERFIPITQANNPNLSKYLSLINDPYFSSSSTKTKAKHENVFNKLIKELRLKYLPFQSNLSPYEFIPTNYLVLIQNLFTLFPNHKLILSDFFHLNNSLIDVNNQSIWPWLLRWKNNKTTGGGAPVVQTRYNGMTVPVSTFLVKPGLFDIFFPTDFDELIHIYQSVLKEYNLSQQSQSSNLKKTQPSLLLPLNQTNHEHLDHDRDPDNHQLYKKIKLLHQNQFLFEYLNSSDFQKTLNTFNNNLKDDHDRHSICGNDVQKQKLRDFSLDSHAILNYYQNVKILIID